MVVAIIFCRLLSVVESEGFLSCCFHLSLFCLLLSSLLFVALCHSLKRRCSKESFFLMLRLASVSVRLEIDKEDDKVTLS